MEQWQSFVEAQANSSIFHHRNWLELLSQQYGFEIQIPAIVNDGQILAAIPFLRTRNLWGAKKLISLPFTDYLPVLNNNNSALAALCHHLQEEFRGRIENVVIRADQPLSGVPAESLNVRHELCTDRPMTEIESSYASAIKRNLRRSDSRQLEFQKRSDFAAMDIFYGLHVLTRRKQGVPVQPWQYFQRLHELLIKPGLGFIGVVERSGEPVAAVVLLGFNKRLVYKYAASDPSALEHRPNDCLVHNSIRIASEEGYHCFDFGISDKKQDGLCQFKRKWGATESDIFHCYLLGEPDSSDGPSRARRIAAEVIRNCPTVVCRALGNAFYKYSQ